MLGTRANAWHTEVLRELPAGIDVTVVATTNPRYRLDEIELPVVSLPWQNEVGVWPWRKLQNLRYRLTRGRGYEFRLQPPVDVLASYDVLHTWELHTEWTRLALAEKRRRRVSVVVTVWDNIPGHYACDPRRGPQ